MNPNTLKIIINGLMAKISSSSKKDWNENDSQSTSYIKNRPFYSEFINIKIEAASGSDCEFFSNNNFSRWFLQRNQHDISWLEFTAQSNIFEILIQEQEKINFSFGDLIEAKDDYIAFGNPIIFAWDQWGDLDLTKEEALKQYNLTHNTSFANNGKNYYIIFKDYSVTCIIEKEYSSPSIPIKLFLKQNKEKIHQIDKKYIPTEMFDYNKNRISDLEYWTGYKEEDGNYGQYDRLSDFINQQDNDIKNFIGFDETLFDSEGDSIEDMSLVEAINNKCTSNQVNELIDNLKNEIDDEIQNTNDSLSQYISDVEQDLWNNYYTKDEVIDFHSALEEYTDHQVAALVNSAPETLDTLGELATAFEENADMVATLNAAVTNKAEKSDLDNLAELVDLNANAIESLQAQVLPTSLILADAITGVSYTIQIQNGQLVSFETTV